MHKKFGPNTLSQKFKEVRKAFTSLVNREFLQSD